MNAFIAFIVLCSSPNCIDKRAYSDKASYTLEICRKHAEGWAIQMFALTKKEYSFGCEEISYKPKEIK